MQQTISYVLRKAKHDFPNLVSGSTTFGGKNYVWIKTPNPEARVAKDTKMLTSPHRRLMDFCKRKFQIRLYNLLRISDAAIMWRQAIDCSNSDTYIVA